jgi:hypothetical protein
MESQAIAPPEHASPLEPYRHWAAVLFWLLAATSLIAVVIALGVGGSLALGYVVSALIGLVVLLDEATALGRRAPWAIHAIRPLCYVIIAAGVFRVIVALTHGTVTIPLEVIGALLVLSREHGSSSLPAVDEPDRWRVSLAVGALIVANVLAYLGGF